MGMIAKPEAKEEADPIDQHISDIDQKLQAEQDRKPMGSPGSSHPGVLGKILHGLAGAGNIAGDIFASGTMALIPGTQLHGELEHNALIGQRANLVAQQKAEAETDELDKPDMTGEGKTVEADGKILQFNPKSGKYDIVVGPAKMQPKSIEEQAYEHALGTGLDPMAALSAVYDAKDKKNAPNVPLPQQYLEAIASGDNTKAALIKRAIHDTETQPRIDVHAASVRAPAEPHSLAVGPDGTVIELKPGVKVPQGTKTVSGELAGPKPTADEQRRADLAGNLNENINTLEDILNRRPELFGPAAGRITSLKSALGTSDPDIAALETIKHQVGMAQISAHGMRSAQGVESAAHSLVNNFNNSPAAMKAGLEAARQSVQTFINDANRPGANRGTPPPATGGVIYARDLQGKLHQAPAGSALPQGWKVEKR
jgi:hypothetical protein